MTGGPFYVQNNRHGRAKINVLCRRHFKLPNHFTPTTGGPSSPPMGPSGEVLRRVLWRAKNQMPFGHSLRLGLFGQAYGSLTAYRPVLLPSAGQAYRPPVRGATESALGPRLLRRLVLRASVLGLCPRPPCWPSAKTSPPQPLCLTAKMDRRLLRSARSGLWPAAFGS